MRFNGVDPTSLHRAISIAREIPPGMPGREITTVRGIGRETLRSVTPEREEYVVRINIGARSPNEAWRVREMIARWARSSGETTAALEPTHRPGVCYDAIASKIDAPEFKPRFATIDVIFLLPDGTAHDVAQSAASGAQGSMTLMIGGTEETGVTIAQTIAKDAQGLEITMDGGVLIRLGGEFAAGQTVEIDFGAGSVTIDGAHAEERIDYTAFTWLAKFAPGTHEIASTDEGRIEARWRNAWA